MVFRDVTLYANVFLHYQVVAIVDPWEMRDGYHLWFKRYGLYDFVEDLVQPGFDTQIELVDGVLNESSLQPMLMALRSS